MITANLSPFLVPVNPQWVPFGGYARKVNAEELKKLLAGNFDRLLAHDEVRRGTRLRHEDVALKAKVGKGTVGRIARGDTAPAVDTLEAVARVFGLRAWQMLSGTLDPAEPPELLTPALRQELVELRAIKAQLEELARGGTGSFRPPIVGDRSADDRQSGSESEGSSRRGPRG